MTNLDLNESGGKHPPDDPPKATTDDKPSMDAPNTCDLPNEVAIPSSTDTTVPEARPSNPGITADATHPEQKNHPEVNDTELPKAQGSREVRNLGMSDKPAQDSPIAIVAPTIANAIIPCETQIDPNLGQAEKDGGTDGAPPSDPDEDMYWPRKDQTSTRHSQPNPSPLHEGRVGETADALDTAAAASSVSSVGPTDNLDSSHNMLRSLGIPPDLFSPAGSDPISMPLATQQVPNGASFSTITSSEGSVAPPGDLTPAPRCTPSLPVFAPTPPPLDLVQAIPGLYRVLDLVSEHGSGGLVDKIVIAQESFGRFINDVYPGAYASMTKVDFLALDKMSVKPIGLYGSKEEIVGFFERMDIVDGETARLLNASTKSSKSEQLPTLRSGLYLLRTAKAAEDIVYAIYWPEDTTWDDGAISSVRRNRITFIRYLTMIADQVVALISKEHLHSIVWHDGDEDNDSDASSDDGDDREFTYEVTKHNEQEENVFSRQGFEFEYNRLKTSAPNHAEGDIKVPQPRLIPGETKVALMDAIYVPSTSISKPLNENLYSQGLRLTIGQPLRLSPHLSESALVLLLRNGLDVRAPQAADIFRSGSDRAFDQERKYVKEKEAEMTRELDQDNDCVLSAVTSHIAETGFTDLHIFDADAGRSDISEDVKEKNRNHLLSLMTVFPEIQSVIKNACEDPSLKKITARDYKLQKERLVVLEHLLRSETLEAEAQTRLINSVVKIEDLERAAADVDSRAKQGWWGNWKQSILGWLPWGEDTGNKLMAARHSSALVRDDVFLRDLPSLVAQYPALSDAAAEAVRLAQDYLAPAIANRAQTTVSRIRDSRSKSIKKAVELEAALRRQAEVKRLCEEFLTSVKDSFVSESDRHVKLVHDVQPNKPAWDRIETYRVMGTHEVKSDPMLQYRIRPFQLTEDDKQRLQLNPLHTPSPRLHDNTSTTIQLSVNSNIIHIQLLGDGKCLLIVDDGKGKVSIYIQPLDALGAAIARGNPMKALNHERVGDRPLMAFDENKRLLCVCSTSNPRLRLNIFAFDERYTSLQAHASAINLSGWYEDHVVVRQISFVGGGSEELVLVDDGGRARIFSLITQQFRPASLDLGSEPTSVYSSPDGSCLFALHHEYLRAFHWSTFGATLGIDVDVPTADINSSALTSLGNRSNIHFVTLDIEDGKCHSIAIQITRKVTEFSFREKGTYLSDKATSQMTVHNSLIDCHSEVWTRFPVIPAVERATKAAGSQRTMNTLFFVSDDFHHLFRPHFRNLIATFEKRTRKPTEGILRNLQINAVHFGEFINLPPHTCSTFLLGEWLVDILCLIPIHIAVARDNRFIPMKDGVMSAEFERSLVGATVDQIVDSLSVGWYESILRSYMVSKPVKVVSSMGEQSVGKSFALNHFVGTSFAGSAMRTTEGVWMSITPTKDILIVSLDFEGVHSIERSAQEDTLLVLFNTAISNLVLFRNNFALSRDITGLFQSFQSSSTVLDPDANPDLFRSTLVIIIKDVVQSDTKEITKEFNLKFSQIVEQEQGSNFISKLHRGRINIMPWPVIESKQFYTMFNRLQRRLEDQPTSHTSAGVFLQTLKTLMAKLKANDWGALSQNLVSQRTRLLTNLLPNAVAYGALEIHPDWEPLKDFDSDAEIVTDDSKATFAVADASAVDNYTVANNILQNLCTSWELFQSRFNGSEQEWMRLLGLYLEDLADRRAHHVQAWLASNTVRFTDNAVNLEELRRAYEKLLVDLRTNIQLCGLQCGTCQLTCILSRRHTSSHDCSTSHRCHGHCRYCYGDSGRAEPCGLVAGHSGEHICDISAHLCGKPCPMSGKRGCMDRCAKVINHDDDEHLCPAMVHECSEPCSLANVVMHNGLRFSCGEPCRIPSHITHTEHECENRSCPLPCQLCRRLCAMPNHLHGLKPEEVHLCGQEHTCASLCSLAGSCQIETAPYSVEATFTGRHEVFQFTKYSQVAKRLPCVVPIPAGMVEHNGKHQHSRDKTVFHFCESKCDSCGYICTLRLGHPQREHETSHGSMSRTQWSVDGPDGTVMELDGRKFASNDDGAPMLCSMVCKTMGRHAHVDYCRTTERRCTGSSDAQHVAARMNPSPDMAKDWISHKLYWERKGFRDPYLQEEQRDFAKCDAVCSGPEHQATATTAAQPSLCVLPLFHPPALQSEAGAGYVSSDGHKFACRNPAVLRQAFHVIFVIDRSSSMSGADRRPLRDTPTTVRIANTSNNRLGSVYSALHAFWTARDAVTNAAANRRDAYTVILFNESTSVTLANDFTSTPQQLLDQVLRQRASGGTNFTQALQCARENVERHWSTERTPIIIFLSDGECGIQDVNVRDLCRRSIALGKPLSFHAVSFGPQSAVLRRMVDVALEVQRTAPADPLHPLVPCSYTETLDTIQLANTFLGIAESLRKPRGSLMTR